MVGAEFLGMILLIVYVGAVAVLFLFVVMMLNVAEQKQSWFIEKNLLISYSLIVSVLILLELLVVVGGWKYKEDVMSSSTLLLSKISNTHQLGLVMYTDYILYFQLAGLVLSSNDWSDSSTFRQRVGVKKQSYINQISKSIDCSRTCRGAV